MYRQQGNPTAEVAMLFTTGKGGGHYDLLTDPSSDPTQQEVVDLTGDNQQPATPTLAAANHTSSAPPGCEANGPMASAHAHNTATSSTVPSPVGLGAGAAAAGASVAVTLPGVPFGVQLSAAHPLQAPVAGAAPCPATPVAASSSAKRIADSPQTSPAAKRPRRVATDDADTITRSPVASSEFDQCLQHESEFQARAFANPSEFTWTDATPVPNDSERALAALEQCSHDVMAHCARPTDAVCRSVRAVLYVSTLNELEHGVPEAATLLHFLGLMRAHVDGAYRAGCSCSGRSAMESWQMSTLKLWRL